MSTLDNNNLAGKVIEATSQEINDALNNIDAAKIHRNPAAAFSELVAAHAMIQVITRHATAFSVQFERLLEIAEREASALEEMAESIDFMAARPDEGDSTFVHPFTDQERQISYRALEAELLTREPPPTNYKDFEVALARIKKLTGV